MILAALLLVLVQDAPATAPASRPAPTDPVAKRALGEELLRHGRKDEAIAALKEAYESDKSLESALALARAQIADERTNDAFRTLDDAHAKYSKDPALHLAYAEAFYARAAQIRGEGADVMSVLAMYEEAARAIETAMELKPADPKLRLLHIRYLLEARKPEEALESAAIARKAAPDSWEAAVLQGDSLVQDLAVRGLLKSGAADGDEEATKEREMRIAAAIAAFADAARLAPDRAEPHERTGILILRTGGDRKKALEEYLQALARDPSRVAPGPATEGMAPKELLEFFEKASAEFAKSHPGLPESAPADATLRWYVGYAKLATDDRAGAAAAFKLAALKNPADTSARYYLGKIAFLEKKHDEAITELDAVARFSPKELAALGRQDGTFVPMIQFLVGRIVGGSGVTSVGNKKGMDSAIRFTQTLLEIDPKNASEWNNLGLFYRDTGKPKESYEAYKRALDLNPRDPRLMNDMAVVLHYDLKNDDAEATRLYERAIARANEILADPKSGSTEKADAQGALDDATSNLNRLKSGVRKEN